MNVAVDVVMTSPFMSQMSSLSGWCLAKLAAISANTNEINHSVFRPKKSQIKELDSVAIHC